MGQPNQLSCLEILKMDIGKRAFASYGAKADVDESFDNPTSKLLKAIVKPADYFNQQIFSDILPPLIFRLSENPKRLAFYKPNAWKDDNEIVYSEISFHKHLFYFETIEIMKVVVRMQICHLQYSFGKPGLGHYYNFQFVQLMRAVGLACAPKNRKGSTGRQMEDSIIPGGLFERKFFEMPGNLKIPFVPVDEENAMVQPPDFNTRSICATNKNKKKYCCPSCSLNAWAKPSVELTCKKCQRDLIEIDPIIK